MNPPETDPRTAAPAVPNHLSHTVHWVIAILLAVIATALWLRPGSPMLPAAVAQGQAVAGARGIFAFTGPLEHNQYGLFMLDVDQGTIWCYAFENQGGTNKLRLVAARTWVYDRYLQDFNCAAPDFRTVQKLVSQQRAQMTTGAASPEEAVPEQRAAPPPGP
ncbi:MAG: hypothetical protein AB1716_04900 [Planctomycetota bacterium]